MDPNVNKYLIIKKINNLKNTYKNELNKIKKI